MKTKRMLAVAISALILSASSLGAVPTAQAIPGGVSGERATTETPEPSPSPDAPSLSATQPRQQSPSQTTAENLNGVPTSAHVFETAPVVRSKGTSGPSLSTEAYSLARTGDIKIRLVTVQLTDVKSVISMDSAIAAVQTASNYWRTMSNNRLSMSVASTESFNSRSASSQQSYSDMMNTITNELGWAPSSYTALVVFVSTPTLSSGAFGAGWSYNGTSGKVIMPTPASLTKSVLTHEFGHVWGLMHANSLQCGSGAQDTATNPDGSFTDSTCSIREYGDTMDLMGASQLSQPTISSTLWDFGGFGRGDEILNVGKASGSQSFTLTAWAGTAAQRAVKFTDPVSGEIYYLELRLPIGYDAATAVNGNRGVKILQQLGAGSLILMPDSTPFSGFYSTHHAWQAGQVFTTHAGTRVSIDWISPSAAGVTIESSPAAALRAIASVASSSPSLGAATSPVTCGLRDGGCFQGFQNGVVMWSTATGAQPSVLGPIRDLWAQTGYEAGAMGYPTSGVICGLTGNGCFQNYQGGAVMWSPASGAAASPFGGIRDFWQQQNFENGPLGYPTSNSICGLKNNGCFQNFQGGTVMWSPTSGAQTIAPGPVQQIWQRSGFENGALGYPTGKQDCNADSTRCTQMFQGGSAAWSSANGGWTIPGASTAAWRPTEIGYPVAAQICGLRGNGCFQNFQQGVLMYSPSSGAASMSGQVLNTWQRTGFENGSLGYPTSAQTCGLKDQGCYQNFEKASVLLSASTGPHPVYLGPFLSSWGGSGFESGSLGYPTSDQFCGTLNGGCFQNFQGGTIMWSPATGAQPLTSAPIRTAWAQSGFENGNLGYPTNAVTCGLKNDGCFQNFEKGTIMWSQLSGAAPIALGPIQTAWGQQGFENGPLGYPTNTQNCTLNKTYCTQNFQGGTITWTPTNGATTTKP